MKVTQYGHLDYNEDVRNNEDSLWTTTVNTADILTRCFSHSQGKRMIRAFHDQNQSIGKFIEQLIS